MDEADRELLSILSANARSSTSRIARELDLSRTTVQARIERLERQGVIRGYTVVKGDAAEEGVLRATALIVAEPRASAGIVSALSTMTEVERLHGAAGRFDLVAELSARGAEALERALDRIGLVDGVRSTESLVHLSVKFDRRSR